MRTFGGFRSGDEFFYGELRGDDVHVLAQPYWIEIEPTGDSAETRGCSMSIFRLRHPN
mgnify:CR=1 FL=1